MRQILFLLILAVATGCKVDRASRSSSQMDENVGPVKTATAPTSETPQPPQPGKKDLRPLIVCFGDSLTAGFGADEGASYPDFLQQDLNRDGFHYRVINEGISGNTTKDGVERLSEVVALHPAVVVLEFGGNDGLRGLKVSNTRAHLATIITALQKSGTKVVLAGITLPPDYGPDYIRSFTANYTSLASQYKVPLLPFLLQNVYGVPGMMQADNIHATNQGNQIVASNVEPYVTPLLSR